MKIGLLTVPFNNNYGGLLQAFALKSVLVGMGHDVVIIDRQRNRHTDLKFKTYYLLVRLKLIKDYLKERTDRISVNTNLFKEKYLRPMTGPYFSSREIVKCMDWDLDAYVVGSDQVWRYLYAKDSILDYFFNFLGDSGLPRFSYAASFGSDVLDYPEDIRATVKHLLKAFSGISVRETSGKELLSRYFDVPEDKIHVVLDPTMLLLPEHYRRLIGKYNTYVDRYLFTYILDDTVVDFNVLRWIKEELSIGGVDIKAQTGKVAELDVIEPVEKWLAAINTASFVITDSFHGTVFSIIFNRPFITVANPTRGISRLKTLLSRFGLEGRLVTKLDKSCMEILHQEIDWPAVNKKWQEDRETSIQYLKKTLNSMA